MGGLRVLVVEDDPELQEIWCEFLGTLGHQVDATSTSAEARAYLEGSATPGVAVVDWTLPDGAGSDVVEALRARRPTCRVVVATGHGHDVTRGLGGDVVAVLRKPFSLKDLAAAIESAGAA